MVYRFDPEWNGEVIAECCGNPIPDPLGSQPTSYLGLHFPASDIPPQARRLFVTNPVRAIADIGSEPVPLVPVIGPLTGRPLDMTHTFLRSPSPVHVEYLRNMGVAASLAISIVVDERLWGVIACHHYAPRPIDCLTRSVCELIARNLSLQITLRNSNAMWHARQAARKLVDGYAEHLEQVDGRVDGASLQDSLFLDLMDADGMVAYIDGVVTLHGTTVEHDALLPVIGKLRESATRGIAGSNNLSALDPGANAFATDVSGALLLDLGKRSKDYVLFVRSEFIRSVDWAGNPDKSVGADVHGKLHPRASFAAWRQTVRGRARPWTDVELDGALFLREQLCHLRDLARIRELEAQDVDDGGGA
jgi:light-regulated signal transduction histidine kinase (bacteriophytochrome)